MRNNESYPPEPVKEPYNSQLCICGHPEWYVYSWDGIVYCECGEKNPLNSLVCQI
jgi:hypothetical protein